MMIQKQIQNEPFIVSTVEYCDLDGEIFNSYIMGDTEGERSRESLVYDIESLPIGSTVVVSVPTCITCGQHEADCACCEECDGGGWIEQRGHEIPCHLCNYELLQEEDDEH